MSIVEKDLTIVETVLAANAPERESLAELRRLLPGITLTKCDLADMGDETPFRALGGYDLFLLDGRNHCFQITADLECATGLVLTPRG